MLCGLWHACARACLCEQPGMFPAPLVRDPQTIQAILIPPREGEVSCRSGIKRQMTLPLAAGFQTAMRLSSWGREGGENKKQGREKQPLWRGRRAGGDGGEERSSCSQQQNALLVLGMPCQTPPCPSWRKGRAALAVPSSFAGSSEQIWDVTTFKDTACRQS